MGTFTKEFNNKCEEIHSIAVSKGWWDWDRNDGELIALMHSELSEALEALRNGNVHSHVIPDFLEIELELADTIIRIMDFARARGYRIGEAIETKSNYNKTRPYKHNNKSF